MYEFKSYNKIAYKIIFNAAQISIDSMDWTISDVSSL